MRGLFVLCAPLSLAACLGPAPPPPPPPSELYGTADCASTVFPTDASVNAATVDKFGGVYRLGRESVTVSRQDHRFLAHRVLYGVRELRADAPGATSFRDGCGLGYSFSLSADGRGGWLTITDRDGRVSRWRRQAY
ncbi:MAG TPA: hypothetical protein VFV47_03505 [Hyphomicrobiaceae bacterium]|nr:hypothetical protein [Hyphomicrobiaceae bacterium]